MIIVEKQSSKIRFFRIIDRDFKADVKARMNVGLFVCGLVSVLLALVLVQEERKN